MRTLSIFKTERSNRPLRYTGRKRNRIGGHFYLLLLSSIIAPALLCGCGHFGDGFKAKTTFEEADLFFGRGEFQASLDKYAQIVESYPTTADRALFEMGTIYAHPKNERKDYQKSLQCFNKLIKDYPGSRYRQDSEMMIFYINNVVIKNAMIAEQQTQIGTLQQEVKDRDNDIVALQQELNGKVTDIAALQKKIEALEQKVFSLVLKTGTADKILVEKKQRRLMLIAKGEVLKTYKIALGGNPNGPKERQGDNKTPEGIYFIDSRSKDSQYHLSLHISYPNERDRKRAKELGVSPGGDIMIHGIKNGLTWVGGFQKEIDWTKGCIAVTDDEIDEIGKLAPNGTVVEIRP